MLHCFPVSWNNVEHQHAGKDLVGHPSHVELLILLEVRS